MTTTRTDSAAGYSLDPAWHAERDRLTSLTRLYDPATLEFSEELGLTTGWRCVDVGAGTGTIAQGFADRVGAAGHVLAIDIDTRFLEPLASDILSIHQTDITAAPLPIGRFDLVHARLVLGHLPRRDEVLRSLAEAVAPGGWLLVEDFDWATAAVVDPPSEIHSLVASACRTVFGEHSYDPEYGRRLPRAVAATGLVDVTTRATSRQVRAHRDQGVPQWELLVEQLSPAILGRGFVTQADLEAFKELCHDDDTVFFAPLMVSCAGRRSAQQLATVPP